MKLSEKAMKTEAISYLIQQDVLDIATAVKGLVGFFGYTRKDIDRLIDAVFEDIEKEDKE